METQTKTAFAIRASLREMLRQQATPAQRVKMCQNVGYQVEKKRHRGAYVGAIATIRQSYRGNAEIRIAIDAPRKGYANCVILPA